jgi:hypothetical protein
MKITAFSLASVAYLAGPKSVAAQGKQSSCPAFGQTGFSGNPNYMNKETILAAPTRGIAGCIDQTPLGLRPTVNGIDANNIYGPLEAGFTRNQIPCLGDNSIPGGVDTLVAELMIEHICGTEFTIMDFCGGHANPYHYHERMNCLYNATASGHSSRVGTALDGRGLYGPNVDGGTPAKDLDVCGGRFGVTPDSNGQVVYYYMIKVFTPQTQTITLTVTQNLTLTLTLTLYDQARSTFHLRVLWQRALHPNRS